MLHASAMQGGQAAATVSTGVFELPEV